MEKKITKREHFNTLLGIEAVAANDELVAFINHEIELLDKKNAKTAGPNPEVLETRATVLKAAQNFDGNFTYKMLSDATGFNPQKVSPAIGALIKEGKVTLVEEVKRVKYFKVVA